MIIRIIQIGTLFRKHGTLRRESTAQELIILIDLNVNNKKYLKHFTEISNCFADNCLMRYLKYTHTLYFIHYGRDGFKRCCKIIIDQRCTIIMLLRNL